MTVVGNSLTSFSQRETGYVFVINETNRTSYVTFQDNGRGHTLFQKVR